MPHVSFIDVLQMPAAALSPAGEVVRLNKVWRDQIELSADEQDRLSWTSLFHPQDRYTALSHLQSATAAQQETGFESRLRNQHGQERWFKFSLQKSAPGNLWLCIGVDIHELKSRQAELERQASMQTDMLDVSVDCIKLIALDGTVAHLNQAGCRALGVASDSGFGMPWLPLLPQDVWAEGEKALAQARAGKFARFAGRSALPGERV